MTKKQVKKKYNVRILTKKEQNADETKEINSEKIQERIKNRKQEESDAKAGHRRGPWGDYGNDPRIDL